MAVNTGTMMTASGQVIGTSKANFPQQMMTGPGKSTIIHSQSGYAPANANQTVVIGQFGVVPNQQSVFSPKALADSQKGKTYTFQNQPTALQPKSLYSSTMPVHSSTQVFNGSHLKQISSQPQIITTQAPGTMFSQAQLLGLQAISPLPAGLSWGPGNCLQTSALQLGQNPIIIRSQQSDMIIQQTQPQTAMHLPVAAAAQPVPPTSFASATVAPQKQKQVKMRPGTQQTQTVAVATQTNVSSAATINSNSTPVRTQIKPKVRTPTGPSPGASPSPSTPQMATSQTQTSQSPPQASSTPIVQQKSDAGNQTYPNPVKVLNGETKSTGIQNKSVSVETKVSSPQKSQAMVAPSSKILQASVAPTPTVDVSVVSTAPSTLTVVSSTTSVMTTASVQANTAVSSVDTITSSVPSVSPIPPVPCLPNKVVSDLNLKPSLPEVHIESVVTSHQTNTTETVATTEHLKPQQPIQKPSLGPVKDKQPQKAIVKPQVLTHVIEGLVIQEGSEPFPVSRSALLDSPCRILPPEKLDAPQKRKDSPTVPSPEKKMKAHRPRGNVELAKCECCGKLGPKSKFKRSKRFCTNSCAKRFNKRSSKHVGMPPSAIQEHVGSGILKYFTISFPTLQFERSRAF
ncbi:unnamed protein product [Larinioides sclopetarius]|uniref:FCS-type domain-containing protein n=1 Tax=Larinioides sclopetarius TaxID=280406 RepID=A0AAV1ZMH0_9ARAC